MTSTTKRLQEEDIEVAFMQWKELSRRISEILINDGCKENRVVFDNGFSLILRDNKSASYRSKQRDLKTVRIQAQLNHYISYEVGKVYPLFRSNSDRPKDCPYCHKTYVNIHTCKKAKKIVYGYSQFGQTFTVLVYSHCTHCDYGSGKCADLHIEKCTFDNCDLGAQTEQKEFSTIPILTKERECNWQ